jgi:hypothetical protein
VGIALLEIHQDELMLLSMEDMLKVCCYLRQLLYEILFFHLHNMIFYFEIVKRKEKKIDLEKTTKNIHHDDYCTQSNQLYMFWFVEE